MPQRTKKTQSHRRLHDPDLWSSFLISRPPSNDPPLRIHNNVPVIIGRFWWQGRGKLCLTRCATPRKKKAIQQVQEKGFLLLQWMMMMCSMAATPLKELLTPLWRSRWLNSNFSRFESIAYGPICVHIMHAIGFRCAIFNRLFINIISGVASKFL